ncbi:hypothetical protein RQP46_005317 [Phenoliferia psychrophenolica]
MKMHIASLASLVVAVSSVAAAVPTAPKTSPVLPADDPFYVPPTGCDRENAAPGTIFRNRTVLAALATAVPLPVIETYQLLYRTTDGNGLPLATVTTVLVPANAAPDKLMAYANAEDSTNTRCAPSYIIQFGSPVETYESSFLLETGLFEAALAQGWIVTLSDYQGPKSAYTAGPQSGKAVLDSIRATKHFGPTIGLLPSARTVMWGYSGGAIAIGWAEALLATYGAPDLLKNVVGAATGGTPADLLASLIYLNNSPNSGFALQALTGLAAGYPKFSDSYYSLATPKMLALIADGIATQCGGDSNANGIDLFDAAGTYFTTGASTLSIPIWQETFALTKLGTANKTLVPSIPMHFYHALADEYIPYKVASDLIQSYCSQGASLTFITDTTPQVEHIAEAVLGAPAALTFFQDRLAGKPFPAGCTFSNVTANAPVNSPTLPAPELL